MKFSFLQKNNKPLGLNEHGNVSLTVAWNIYRLNEMIYLLWNGSTETLDRSPSMACEILSRVCTVFKSRLYKFALAFFVV